MLVGYYIDAAPRRQADDASMTPQQHFKAWVPTGVKMDMVAQT